MHSSLSTILCSALLFTPTLARSHSNRNHRRQTSLIADSVLFAVLVNPVNLSNGSLNVTSGCTGFESIVPDQYCYIVSDKWNITLSQFYVLNPQIDDECMNLIAGQSYCISGTPHNTSKTKPIPLVSTKVSSSQSRTVVESSTTLISSITSFAASPTSSPEPTSSSNDSYNVSDDSSSSSDDSSYNSSSSDPTSTSTANESSSTSKSAIMEAGISSFLGTNSGIGSWFKTNSPQDSTNGHSWCGYPYYDTMPGFAPDVTTMLNNFGGDYVAAGVAYCGLEVEVTNPNNGKSMLLYIADGFDSKWVRTPGSIDIVYPAFENLYGSYTDKKEDVIQGLSWKFTGKRNPDLGFKGYGH